MLFPFRGLRTLQLIMAFLALFAGLAWAVIIATYAVTGLLILLIPFTLAGLVFAWLSATAFRLQLAYVSVSESSVRVRFADFIDATIPHADVLAARVTEPESGKFGAGMDLRGKATFAAAQVPFCELSLARPVRAWLIPRVWPVSVRTLRLGVADPEELAKRFGSLPAGTIPASPSTTSPRTMNKQQQR